MNLIITPIILFKIKNCNKKLNIKSKNIKFLKKLIKWKTLMILIKTFY